MSITFEELLRRDGKLIYKTKGVSMRPMLRQNRDLVIIEPPKGRLRPKDVALYRRGKNYVLHRVISVEKGYYLIRGDNTYALEKVPDQAILGVLTGFVRKGRQHRVTDRGYLLYVRIWCAIYPLRRVYMRIRRRAYAAAKKLGLIPLLKKILRRP